MQSKKLYFDSRRGHQLAAFLDLPDAGQANYYAVFAHCFTCGKSLKSNVYIARALTASGIAVLRIDFSGLGESGGEFAESNFSTQVEDVQDAATYLQEHFQPPDLLIGHSFGGATVLQAASQLDSLGGVVTINGSSLPAHVLRHFDEQQLQKLEEEGEAEVMLAGRTFSFHRQFLQDVRNADILPAIRTLPCPLLVLHSPVDETINFSHAERIYQTAKADKQLLRLEGMDHLLSKSADATRVGEIIANWWQEKT